MKTKQIKKLIGVQISNRAWDFIAPSLDNISWHSYGKNYLAENLAEEKAHRGCGLPPRPRWGISVHDAARLFATQQLLECVLCNPLRSAPGIASYLSCRKSVFTAASLYANYPQTILDAFAASGANLQELHALDYAELVKI